MALEVGRDGEPDGFVAPMHTALNQPLLVMGVPRTPCYVLWTLGAAFAFGMQELWVAPITIAVHLGFKALTDIDPYFFTVLRNELRAPRRLDP